MKPNRHLLLCLALLASPALRADVTLRYETKTVLNPALPPQLAETMMKTLSMAVPDMAVQQFHNGKVFYTQGKTNLIVDTAKKEITLIDNAGKRYATVPAAQYADEVAHAIPEVPAQAKALLGSMKAHMATAPGGGTATIQGIEAEEHNVTITIDAPAGGPLPAGPLASIVLHIWMSKGSEALRVAALREVSGYNIMSMEALNPLATIETAFRQFPGMGDSLAALTKDLTTTGSIMLRSKMELVMPMLAAMAGQTGGDPNAPFATMTQDVSQVSTEPIPDSVFQIPEGFQPATVAEILKSTASAISAPAAPAK